MSGTDLLEAILDTISDTVLSVDLSDHIITCGGGSAWALPDEVQGRPLSDVFGEELTILFSNLCKQARVDGEVAETEVQITSEAAPFLKDFGLSEPRWYRVHSRKAGELVVFCLHDFTMVRQLEQRVSHQSQRDPLTGAYNRRALVPVLNQSIAQAQRYEYNCSLLLCDVDGFSALNEKYGWDGGDQILQQLVAAIHQMKRTADFLARVGDDRFALFLPETSRDQSVAVGRRILSLVDEMEVPSAHGDIRYHVSVGTSSMKDAEDSSELMIKRANENLMIAKQSGGNRVEGDEE